MPEYQSYEDWIKSLNPESAETQTQVKPMDETTQELPAVSKLREAFDTARNAILEGTQLANIVKDLRTSVANLTGEVHELQRDLEYVRNRNKELDEQVSQVREARDRALADAKRQEERAILAEAATSEMRGLNATQGQRIETFEMLLTNALKERDDAMIMALEYEGKFKIAEAKLATISEVFSVGEAKAEPKPPMPREQQPRDEVGKFQPTTYDRGSQNEG